MAILDIGRVCRKTCGRDAGEFCVIVAKAEGGFTVENAKTGKVKVSGSHLEPTPWVVEGKDVPKGLANLKLA